MCSHLILAACLSLAQADEAASSYFTIQVVDDRTERGVPLVELTTVDQTRYYTDSQGIVALDDPALWGSRVFFHVKSHGYEFPPDGFGIRGRALDVTAGGSARLALRRINLAERLYRVTGANIYRDSLLAGRSVPIREPILNAQVSGCDSVLNAIYQQKLFWVWGDTNRLAYPLGNFQVTGATSRLPAAGGMDPQVGVDLDYFRGEKEFVKPLAPMAGEGPTWIVSLVTLEDQQRRERLFASYVKVRAGLEVYRRGLAEFDDEKQEFRHLADLPLDAPLLPQGQALLAESEGRRYVYFASPFAQVRVPAEHAAFADLSQYEGFTCLAANSRLADMQTERDDQGRLVWGWKRNTPPVDPEVERKLLESESRPGDMPRWNVHDRATGKPIRLHAGSVCWNAYKSQFVMIAVEMGGSSNLGEIWFLHAPRPEGPWDAATRIVTHDNYSFYNPKQHPYFDQEGGRYLYFEGTYTATFSGNTHPTPGYDYNQIMYRLDLADERLGE